jgi:hypothetical protein
MKAKRNITTGLSVLMTTSILTLKEKTLSMRLSLVALTVLLFAGIALQSGLATAESKPSRAVFQYD